MSVVVYSPGSLPPTVASFPEGNLEYSTASSYQYWLAAGGPGQNPPSPNWFCQVADLPGTVESRTDGNHIVNQLSYTSVSGGETSVTLNVSTPVVPSSVMLSTAPVVTKTDAYGTDGHGLNSPMLSIDKYPQLVQAQTGSGGPFISVVSGVLHATANGSAPTVGVQYRLGAGWPANLASLPIQIATASGTNGPFTATFVGTPPADFSNGLLLGGIGYLVPRTGTLVGANSLPANAGTIDYEAGQVNMILPFTMTAGQKIYITYATRHANLGQFFYPWTNVSALQNGTGPANCALGTQSYDYTYGAAFFRNSQWLVCRNFGFNIPAGSTIQRIVFAWESTCQGTDAGYIGTANVATLVGNQIVRAPYTQVASDLKMQFYWDQSFAAGQSSLNYDQFFGSEDAYWPDATYQSTTNQPVAPWPVGQLPTTAQRRSLRVPRLGGRTISEKTQVT